MDSVLHEYLGSSVPALPRCPSPPCSRSSLPKGLRRDPSTSSGRRRSVERCGNPATEEGDSREHVDKISKIKGN